MTIYNPEPHLFLMNKFTHSYYHVVKRAGAANRSKLHPSDPDFVYYESHHIIPRALGGSDEGNNLVLLTAYEHYLCHWLLTKMCVSEDHRRKMFYPLRRMNDLRRNGNLKNLADLYHASKRELAQIISDANRGLSRSKEFRSNLSTRMGGSGNHMYGKKHSEDTLELMREAKRGSKNPNSGGLSEDHKRKIGEAQIGKVISETTRAKQRKTYLVVFPDGKQEIVYDRLKFCTDHNLSGANFSCAAASGKPYRGYLIRVNRA